MSMSTATVSGDTIFSSSGYFAPRNLFSTSAPSTGTNSSAAKRSLFFTVPGPVSTTRLLTRYDLGWTREFAGKIRSALDTFAPDWDDPTMDVYDLR